MFQIFDGALRATSVASIGSNSGAAVEVLQADELLGIGLGTDILVVDDDTTNLTAYEAALAPLGRQVVLVSSGMQALAQLLARDFALLLLDVSMPEMSGIETAQQIRQRARNKGLPIIFITGMEASATTMLEAYDVGAFDFVIKPIPPDVLRAKARVYLQLQERTQGYMKRTLELREANRQLSEANYRLRERDQSAATALRLQKLQDATAALAQASTPAEVASVAVRLGAEAVNASSACLWIVRPDGALAVETSHGVPAHYLDPWRVLPADAELAMTHVQRERRAIWVENAADYAREAPELFERARAAGRLTAFAMLPLVAEDRAIGVVSFGFDRDRAFPDEERRFLAALVRTCEQALDRARLYSAEAAARRVAEAASRRKDEFLAMLNHELRNPLWAMVSALGVINSSRDGATGRELDIMGRQVEHLTEIVNGLLDFSQISRGQIQLRREAVPLASAVASAMAGVRPLIDRRAHQVSIDIASDLMVSADRHRLRQVLEHLLMNAVKYTGERGCIAVAAARDGPFIRMSVRDNGRGIAPPLLAELFEPFVQGEQPLDRRDGGLGIGLTLVRNLVELHGGAIEAHSDGPGTGATFTLRWPPGSPTASPIDDSPGAEKAAVTPRRVLIVDDNSDAGDMLAMLLRTFGHQVSLAFDGAAALDGARDFAPHVALLDLGLPGMDGYELARRLRELDTCKKTLLVAVTGYGELGDRQRSKAAGFAHHFVKPVNPLTFKTLLATLSDDDAP